ncbi:threonine-phosphate decarboxylase CobD [Pseudohoeflea coraliihabitans]|uniref:Threonine-phosphate decarboxylase CobD n=1 Tax=Pseudohoeflea coraliihabitans TaxID=2860393 RepID=A0ABS6WIF4_9HYPH|nr:threonine-phosphate decarboxylase CobD [Pseudohoeflea sp. DP4N28-3]MBW3095738.1 threonine-phosphate decarboxylase CobD [Pseudohoeflea sp. DP4N28-3]
MVVHGGALREAMEHNGGEAAEWLDLSTGISPHCFPLPDLPTATWQRLPDPGLVEAVAQAARDFYGGADAPCITPGSQAAIQHLPTLARLIDPKSGHVAVLAPTYGEYEAAFTRAGYAVSAARDLADAAGSDVVVLANPNNPDGRQVQAEGLLDFARARTGRLTVIDEAFADLHPDVSVARWAGEVPGLVVLRSFGKFFGLAGVRLGFAFLPAPLAVVLKTALGPWPVSGPALEIARHAFSRPDLVAAQRACNLEAHALTRCALVQSGQTIVGETKLFFLIAVADGARARAALAQRHILSRAFDHSPRWLRLGLVRDEKEASRLKAGLAGLRVPNGC